MKRILFLILATFLAMSLFAQIDTFPYMENFDGEWTGEPAAPAEWLVVNNDADAYTWTQDDTYLDPHSGDWVAHGMGSVDDYLITPALDFTGVETRLKWWDVVESASQPNSYDVLVSTTDTALASFTDNLGTYECTNTDWAQYTLDLSAYSGQTIYVAFHQTSSASSYWGFGIDDVLIEELPTIGLLSVSGDPIDFGLVQVGASADYSLSLSNTGVANLTVSTVSTAAPFTTDFVEDITIAPGESADLMVSFSPATVASFEETLTIDAGEAGSAEVILMGDSYPAEYLFNGFEEDIPDMWSLGGDMSLESSSYSAYEGEGYVSLGYGSAAGTLTSGLLALDGDDNISFYAKNSSYSGGSCDIETSTDGENFTLLQTLDLTGDYQLFVIDLSSMTSDGYVRFNAAAPYLYLDNLYHPPISDVFPGMVSNPSPVDSGFQIPTDVTLNWDFGANTDTYDLYFGAGSLPETPVVVDAAAGATGSYTPEMLDDTTVYYWQVVAKNAEGTRYEAAGPIWSFQTALPEGMAQIGAGTETNQSLPIESYYGYTYSQTIYTADQFVGIDEEIEISKIWYNYSKSSEDDHDSDDWTIYMNTTTQDELTDWLPIAGFTQVYSDSVGFGVLPAGDGWLEIELETPFTYDPAFDGNLVIAVDENHDSYTSSSDEFYNSMREDAQNVSAYYYSDSTNPDPAAPPAFETRAQAFSSYYPNIRFEFGTAGPPTSPTVSAPMPTVPESDVISLYSNAYDNVDVTTWSAEWDVADVADVALAGDDMKEYTNLVFAGIEFPTIDATAMTNFCLDIWTPDEITDGHFNIKLVDFGADGAYAGGDDVEHELSFDTTTTPALVTGEWIHFDIPISDFVNLTTTGHLAQLIFQADPGPNTVYVDNVYFYAENTNTVDYQVRLYDSYGDGWDSASLDVMVNESVVLDDITLATGNGPEAFTFAVEDGDAIEITYAAGTYPGENSYDIVNDEGTVIYTSAAPPDASYSFVVGAIVVPNVFFSEYIEGSSNNKAFEIYNGTGEDIDLSNFVIYGNYNGNPWSEVYPFAVGTMVAAGDVYVLASDEADQWILDQADVTFSYGNPWYMTAFNGDDARALGYIAQGDTVMIDIIGDPSEDPGSGWDVAGVTDGTKDHTLVRKDDIMIGNVDWMASAGTSTEDSEWNVYEQNTFSYLGWHLEEPAYISGTITIDALGDLADATVTAGDVMVYADETGHYFMNVVPGTYDVVAEMPGYETVTESAVECTVGMTSNVDFALTVIPEDLWPPVNLEAEIAGNNVNVSWTAPTQYGWNTYYDGIASLTWGGPERAVLFDVTDFGFSYPMTLSAINHYFYEHPSYPWGEDTTFTFKIYDADGTTVIHTSDVITANAYPQGTMLTLDTPITVSDNFYVSVVPTGESGFPSSLFDADEENLHGYVGSPGAWGDPYADFATLVYIEGEAGPEVLTFKKESRKSELTTNTISRAVKRADAVAIDKKIVSDNSTRDLLSFNVFRDGTQLNTEPVYDVSYIDADVPAGEHTYYATAIWNSGESGPSNTATVNLSFGNLTGNVSDEEGGVEGAIVNAGDYSATTDENGDYTIANMLIGTYEVTCSATGYEAPEPQTAEILADQDTVINFTLSSSDGTIAFYDDFESGADNWTFDAESSWGLTEEGAHSPTHSMTESPNANYAASLDISSTLATPWDLTDVFGAQLSFWYKSDIETGFDYMALEVSTDGENWENLAMYDEEDGMWQEETIAMGGFVGPGYETVSIRFRFNSDGGYETVGMLIDDITLTTYDTDTFEPFISHTGPTFYEGTADDYEFTANIVDISGIEEANVVYTVDGGEEMSAAFTEVDGNVYTFVIPMQEAGAQVDYSIQATDGAEVPNTTTKGVYSYIAGSHFIYDNGVVDFYTVFNEGDGAAQLIENPPGNQLNLAYALIRNYTDQSGQDNDDFEFHVWSNVDGLPGEDLITPFVVSPEASYENTSPMTRIDLRPYAEELNDIQGNFFIGFLVNQQGEHGTVHCTISQPANFPGHSFVNIGGAGWQTPNPDSDYHFRAVAELITVDTGTVEGIVSNMDGDPIEGATVTVGTGSTETDATGYYSLVADPGTQPVVVEATDYEVYEGSVEVMGNETVTMDVDLEMILWAPQNLSYNYNDPNIILSWEAPSEPENGEEVELIYDDGVSTGAYSYTGYSMGAQMSPAEACQVLTLKFHTSEGTEFNAEVWGWDAGAPTEDMLYQELTNAVVDDWVEVDVSTENMMIDGDFVVAFGSINGDTYLSYDANLDNGRAWDHADAGGWSSWTEAYLVRAVVQYTDGTIAEIAPTTVKQSQQATSRHNRPGRRISIDAANDNVDAHYSRALAGYNVYRNDVQLNENPVNSLLYVDQEPIADCTYYVTAVYQDPDGESAASNSVTITEVFAENDLVLTTELRGNYPNPFNPTTTISFSLLNPGKVSLRVYNAKGQIVKTLINSDLETANYEVVWDGRDENGKAISSGIYFYRMQTADYSSTKKMMMLK